MLKNCESQFLQPTYGNPTEHGRPTVTFSVVQTVSGWLSYIGNYGFKNGKNGIRYEWELVVDPLLESVDTSWRVQIETTIYSIKFIQPVWGGETLHHYIFGLSEEK